MESLFTNYLNSFSVYSSDGITQHIRQHLQHLLNTRQNSVSHLRDYGIPDLPQLLADLPHSQQTICDTIATVIERYEPRLSQITIQGIDRFAADREYELCINGRLLARYPIQFNVILDHEGKVKLQ